MVLRSKHSWQFTTIAILRVAVFSVGIAPKEHLRLTGLCSYVCTYVRAPRWKISFTPYLVVELSPSAEIRCMCVTSINDGAQILTFLGIHNNRDFSEFSIFVWEFNYFKS